MITKEKLIEKLRANYEEDDEEEVPVHTNETYWTLADLFARQWLNNGWDGFGMVNVEKMYNLLCEHKQLLIDNDMISRNARNNSGFPLWKNYNFDSFKGGEGE
tara:strand:+ start:1963 stop:2271 length:309 start_codon:yes stop_codon:yes gene_type:complete